MPGEATALAGLVERRTLEFIEIEARLAALKARLATHGVPQP
jgi:hypothetical protein